MNFYFNVFKEMEALMSDEINNSINNIENKDNNQQQTTSEV